MKAPTLGFIGAGKVGHTLARLWYARGYTVRAIYSRTLDHARDLANQVSADITESPASVVQAADLTLLTVPDDAIRAVVGEIEKVLHGQRVSAEKAIVHTSGALGAEVLLPLTNSGFMTGSMHPAFPFADVEAALIGLPGATFGIETDARVLHDWVKALVGAVDGRIFVIPPGGKAIYHTAFVFASNYVVTLYAMAEKLLVGLGAERAVANNALNGLLAGTLANLTRQGIPDALTGPLVRGDSETIRLHLEALDHVNSDLGELYRQLARLSLPMLEARQIETSFVEQILDREANHASDHP
jgi:predicted short-subunit dehydrogenase-like oxidoreductase (DUF2520 family)